MDSGNCYKIYDCTICNNIIKKKEVGNNARNNN